MKKKLCDLLLIDLIELACGNLEVLQDRLNPVPAEWLSIIARGILSEYSFIADGAHARSVLMSHENELKENAHIMILKICANLVKSGNTEETKEILAEIGESTDGTEEELAERIDTLLKYAQFEHERNMSMKEDAPKRSAEEIRSSFYSEIAFMMTYYKMQIDERKINAQVYANMVKQVGIEIRSRQMRN